MEVIDQLFKIALTLFDIDKGENNSISQDRVDKVIEQMKTTAPTFIKRELSEDEVKKLRFEIQNHFNVSLNETKFDLQHRKFRKLDMSTIEAQIGVVDFGFVPSV